MTARPPSGPVRRVVARSASRALGVLARRRPWPGVGTSGDAAPGAVVRRLAVPAPSRRDASVLVVTPVGGDVAAMPVLHLLHGYPDAPEAPLAAGLASAVAGASSAGETWPPFILAVPVGVGWRRGDHEWADAADGVRGDLMETWLVDHVVPAVEGAHPRPASRRTLAGFSMGGYGALNVGLRHPDVFGSLAGFAGYFRADDPEGALGGDLHLTAANSPLLRVTHPATCPPRGLRVALVETDHEPSLIAGQSAPMAAALRRAGTEVLELHRRGAHAWLSVAAAWPEVLTWLATGWEPPDR